MIISNLNKRKKNKKRFIKLLPLIFLVLGIIFIFVLLPIGVILIFLSLVFFQLSFSKSSFFMVNLNKEYQRNIISEIAKENKLNISFKRVPTFDKTYLLNAKIISSISSVKYKNLSAYFYKRISIEDVCVKASLNESDKAINNKFRFIKLRFPSSLNGKAIITFNKNVYDRDLHNYGIISRNLNNYNIYASDEITYSKLCDSSFINSFITLKQKFNSDFIISFNNYCCYILVNKENELFKLDINTNINEEMETKIIANQLMPLVFIDTLHLNDLFIYNKKKLDSNIPDIVKENIINPIMKNIVNPIKEKFSPDPNKEDDYSIHEDEIKENDLNSTTVKEEEQLLEKEDKDYTDNFF
ncbi:MAG: DUF3137 domain-containing protein [Anaeroplasmataceae bacterium]